jgi:uridine phosphorylase
MRIANVLNFEMESSTIFTLSNIYGARAGAVCAAIAQRSSNDFMPGKGIDEAIAVANEAVRLLHEWDEAKEKAGKKFFFPSLLK